MRIRILTTVIIACLLMSISCPLTVSAAPPRDTIIEPNWTNISAIILDLSFSGGKAYCSSIVLGKPGTISISATYTLQCKNIDGTFSTVKTWFESCLGDLLIFDESHIATIGNTYRLSVSVKVTSSGGYTEHASDWVEAKY